METRYLTQVIYQGTTKIAQYGRFDGGPLSAGVELARWLAECETPSDLVLSRIADTVLYQQQQIGHLIGDHTKDWEEQFPELSPKTGMKILELVATRGPLNLIDRIDLVSQPFCKYHYAIDFDSQTISINGSKWINFENWTYDLMEQIAKLQEECISHYPDFWIEQISQIEFV